jgi:hypothetical protein
MRTQADRDVTRATRENAKPYVTSHSGEAAALRMLGHVATVDVDRAAVVQWTFPGTARADALRYVDEARRAAAERRSLWRRAPSITY